MKILIPSAFFLLLVLHLSHAGKYYQMVKACTNSPGCNETITV